MTEYHNLSDVQARLQAAQVKQDQLGDLATRFRVAGDGQVASLARELEELTGEPVPLDEFEIWRSHELQIVGGQIDGLQDLLAAASKRPRNVTRQIRREKHAAVFFKRAHRRYQVNRYGEEDLLHLRKKARLVRTLRRRPGSSCKPGPVTHDLQRVAHRRPRALRSARRTSGVNRSGPTAEAGPRSAAGDDPDGPPPPHLRANAPHRFTADTGVGHAAVHAGYVGHAGDTAANAATTALTIQTQQPKETSMFRDSVTRHALAAAVIVAAWLFTFAAPAGAEGGSHVHPHQAAAEAAKKGGFPMPVDPEFHSRINMIKTAARNSVDQVATDLGYVLHREGQTLRMQGGASRSDNALAIFDEGRAWWDFSLNEGGDVIDFLVKKEQWSFQQACGWLAERAGTIWSSASAEEVQEQERRRRASDALTAAFEFMSRQLPPDVVAELRQDRDLLEEDMGRYRFGWQTEALRGYLEALGFSESELCQTGLFSLDGRPKFSGRVLIPFVQGTRIVSYIGRATSAAPTHEQQTRYKKPAGEDVPDDGYLFGINTVAHATAVLVVEGPFDAIACHRAGFAAVAACGSSLSEKQAKRLVSALRDGVRIVLVPDADPPGVDGRSAGLEGAKKTAKLAWELGARLVFVARLPLAPDGGKHDPDSYVRAEGEDKFRQLVAEAEHLPFFLLKLIDQRKSAIDQSRELEVVLELLAELDDAIMEEPFFKAAAEHLILKEKTVEKKYRAVQKKLKNARDGQEDGEMLRIAQQANELTDGELLCLAPPKSAKEHAAFHRVQPEGHILPVPPEALHDLVNEAAGRPLEPAEFTLVTWFLATSVLEHRGGEVIQTGILCKNGFIEFGRNPTFTPGRPDRPSQFYVPRNFITKEGALPELEELEIVKGFRSWGLDLIVLLEVIAHAVLTEPPGEFFLFYGPGGEGKSTFARFIGLLLGEWNVLYTTAEEFSGDRRLRGIASTRGRLLVVVDDASARVLDTMGNFLKEATTAPSLTGAALYENPTTFANASCFVILSNHPSRRQDKSRGGQDRVQVLVWGNRLRATAAGVHSIEKIWSNHAAELDVIFSYAVRLAMDYARTGRWRCSAAPEQNLHIVEVLASTEGRFLWEQFERADDEFLDWDLVEELFHSWWPDYNHRPRLDHERFVQAVAITWGGRAQRRQVDGDRQRGVLGIRPLPKQVAVESPRPSLEEVFPGVIKGQSGQKNPRNEVPSSEKKKHEKEEKLSTEKNHTEKRSLPAVGNPGHPLACEDLALLAGAALDDEDHLTRARREILLRTRSEGGLHLQRAENILPAHLRSQFDRLVSEMVAAGELVLDGVWLHVSDVGEVSP